MAQAPQPAKLEIAPQYLLILAAPVAVYLLLEFILKTFGDGALQLPADSFAEPARLIELTGRYKFMAAFAFFGAVSVSILAIFALDIATNYSARTVRAALLALVASAAFGVVLSVLEPDAFGNFETYYLLGREFFEASLSLGKTGLCADGEAACLDRNALDMFRILTNPINALTSFGAAAALTGLILSLATRPVDGADLERQADALKSAQAVSQRYLYCAGVLLTSGMTFLLAWMHWPSPLIAEPDLRAAYNDLVGAVTLYVGVGYSVMILSCYLPVMLIHVRRAERLRAQAGGAPEAEKLALPQLNYIKALNAVVAILSPIMASAIGSFGQGVLFP